MRVPFAEVDIRTSIRPTVAEIDLGAVQRNLLRFRERVGRSVAVFGVVKADAYGHGAVPVARALEPFRTRAPSDQTSDSGVSLSLTKALVEANRAKFQIKTGGRSGTLIEVVFPHVVARV